MDKIEQIMAEANELLDGGKLTDWQIAELCRQKFQHMLDVGGMMFKIGPDECPACLKHLSIYSLSCTKANSKCILAQAKHSCHKTGSHWKKMSDAKDYKDQATFTTQVKWFVAFFEKWLEDNPE